MKLLHGIFLGMGLLILVYLGVRNKDGVVAIFNSTGQNTIGITKALQGR
jgi:hypothetical protein